MPEHWIAGARLVDPGADGEPREAALRIENGRIAAIGGRAPRGARDATGLWIVPAVIDAHVHLAFAGDLDDVAAAELRAGVAAVLDLGMPERLLGRDPGSLRVVHAGPLLTAPGGYPTATWGRDGYGLELSTPESARDAVRRLAAAGVRFVKLAFDARTPVLEPAVASAAAAEAHRLGLRVAAHALTADMVVRALAAGCDVLAHVPAELPRDVPPALTIISTLAAFGGPVDSLRRLRAAGGRIIYGTDLGNEGTRPGIDARELELLAASGLSPGEVLRAATVDAAALLGLPAHGRIAPGFAASLLALEEDPLHDPTALSRPRWALIDGAPPR